jgi:hypothetical protein
MLSLSLTTYQYQFQSIGKRRSKPVKTRKFDLVYWNLSQLGNLSHGATEWSFVPLKMENHAALSIFNP